MTESVFVDEKTWFGLPGTHLSAFLDSIRFHLIAFKSSLYEILVNLATHHIASKSFETLHTSSNHGLLTKKLSLIF